MDVSGDTSEPLLGELLFFLSNLSRWICIRWFTTLHLNEEVPVNMVCPDLLKFDVPQP
jgi:hypothetical protein